MLFILHSASCRYPSSELSYAHPPFEIDSLLCFDCFYIVLYYPLGNGISFRFLKSHLNQRTTFGIQSSALSCAFLLSVLLRWKHASYSVILSLALLGSPLVQTYRGVVDSIYLPTLQTIYCQMLSTLSLCAAQFWMIACEIYGKVNSWF